MADTTFSSGTVVQSSWLNDVNRFVYDAQTAGAAKGAFLVKFLNSATGGAGRTAQDKLKDVVDVKDFGASTSGDATTAFQNALNAVSALGGGIVEFSENYSILNNLSVPDYCSLVGRLQSPGSLQDGGVGGNYDAYGSTLKVASTATITLNKGSALMNCLVIRSGLDLPFANLAAAQAGVPLFAGTAVTVAGDDAKVDSVLFLGFAKAIFSNNRARMRFNNVQGDCTNGIEVANALDVIYISNCHFWPFTTANYSWTASDTTQLILTRSGIAIHLSARTDWPQITNCFSYGYYRGIRTVSMGSARISDCAVDGPVSGGVTVHSGSIGMLFEGTFADNSIQNSYVAGKSSGYYYSGTSGYSCMTCCDAVACTIGHDIQGAVDVLIQNGLMRACSYPFQIGNASAAVHIVGSRTRETITKPFNVSVAAAKIYTKDLDFDAPSGGAAVVQGAANWVLPSVASADPLNLPGHAGDMFNVTGTTGFGTLNGGYPGRTVTLIFAGVLNVLNGGNMRLNGATTFATAAGRTLKLTYDGSTWREVGRCT